MSSYTTLWFILAAHAALFVWYYVPAPSLGPVPVGAETPPFRGDARPVATYTHTAPDDVSIEDMTYCEAVPLLKVQRQLAVEGVDEFFAQGAVTDDDVLMSRYRGWNRILDLFGQFFFHLFSEQIWYLLYLLGSFSAVIFAVVSFLSTCSRKTFFCAIVACALLGCYLYYGKRVYETRLQEAEAVSEDEFYFAENGHCDVSCLRKTEAALEFKVNHDALKSIKAHQDRAWQHARQSMQDASQWVHSAGKATNAKAQRLTGEKWAKDREDRRAAAVKAIDDKIAEARGICRVLPSARIRESADVNGFVRSIASVTVGQNRL